MRHNITVGLVVPFADDKVPAEGLQMYPGVRFIAKGVGVRALTPEGYVAQPGKPASIVVGAKDFDGAVPLLKKAVELEPSADNLRALAGCLARLNRFDEAAVYYRKFLQVAPNDPSAPGIRQALQEYENNAK